MFSILRQAGTTHVEERIATQYAMTADVPIASVRLEALGDYAVALREGATVPVGTVEFVRKAMSLARIADPPNMTYPDCLLPYLYRRVARRRAGSVLGRWFVKPVETKVFTGAVFDTLGNPDDLSFYDPAQYNAFLSLSPEIEVRIGEPVTWRSEVRYYVIDGEIRGEGRYDDGPDDAPVPDGQTVSEMVSLADLLRFRELRNALPKHRESSIRRNTI
ncbi:MAG: hypothetical protein QOC89_4066 [Paraburkholderia sp.]|jgi:hypothetical protein|nr:hypothetical protein [Paraburkholderia sp.]